MKCNKCKDDHKGDKYFQCQCECHRVNYIKNNKQLELKSKMEVKQKC